MVNQKIFEILEGYLPSISTASKEVSRSDGRKVCFSPFFSSLMVKHVEKSEIETKNGGVTSESGKHRETNHGRVEIRMGNPIKGGSVASNTFCLPIGLDKRACGLELWQAANEAFWACASDLEDRFSESLGLKESRDKFLYFSREKPVRYLESEEQTPVDINRIEDLMKKVSHDLLIKKLANAQTDFSMVNERRYLINSEGSKIFTTFKRYSIRLGVMALDSKNRIIPHGETIHVLSTSKIPDYESLMSIGRRITSELLNIVSSPIEKNGVYPTLIDCENHGVFWHEVTGHPLEADRMQEDDSGDKIFLFKDKIGEQIAPKFINLYDDPTIPGLDGHYFFDDEGVRGKRVELIRHGILQCYLHSRQSAGYFKTKSNGHARSEKNNDPGVRMSNIIVESSDSASFEELKKNLIDLCKQQSKPYGLVFLGTSGGLTLPEESIYQTFPANVFRLYTNGKMERTRGVYVVGTPYQALSNIIRTSSRTGIFRGSCGSGSGWIPSTETAPDALIRSLEVNRIPDDSYDTLSTPVLSKP
jgi:predicted Zn-dependent protease